MKKYMLSLSTCVLMLAFGATDLQAQIAECVAFPQGGAIVGWAKYISHEKSGNDIYVNYEIAGRVQPRSLDTINTVTIYDCEPGLIRMSSNGYITDYHGSSTDDKLQGMVNIGGSGGGQQKYIPREIFCADPNSIGAVERKKLKAYQP